MPATANQIATIRSLAEQTGTDLSGRDLGALSFDGASRWIKAGIAKAATMPRKAPAATVPAGRYMIGEGFYVVDVPTEGKWAGWTFVRQQAGDEQYPVKGERKGEILRAIGADPQAAMLAYGREIGACGHCGRTLTNAESRELGIGPVCREKMGW